MGVNVWHCHWCNAALPIGQVVCDKCKKEHEVSVSGIEIDLGDITYSRSVVARGPTGIVLFTAGHLGRRAISCEYMPQELQDQIREFVEVMEEARDRRREENESEGGGVGSHEHQ